MVMLLSEISNTLLLVCCLLSLKHNKRNSTGIHYIFDFVCNLIYDYIDSTEFRILRHNLLFLMSLRLLLRL
jgi:hypothetical protein